MATAAKPHVVLFALARMDADDPRQILTPTLAGSEDGVWQTVRRLWGDEQAAELRRTMQVVPLIATFPAFSPERGETVAR